MRTDGTRDKVRARIMGWERGRIIFIDDFVDMESQWGVRIGLSVLAEEGFILRLARGVYLYPKMESEHSKKTVTPDPEVIAHAIASKSRVRIAPFGDQAAYSLGLTGMRLSDHKYLTDGAPRTINLSNGRKIQFFHTSEMRIFDFCNDTMQKVSSAIRALKEENIDESRMRILHGHLKDVPEREFLKDLPLSPAWVQEILKEAWGR